MSDGATVGRSEKVQLPQAFAHYLCVQWWVEVVYLHGFPLPYTNNLKHRCISLQNDPFCLALRVYPELKAKLEKEPDLWLCQQ